MIESPSRGFCERGTTLLVTALFGILSTGAVLAELPLQVVGVQVVPDNPLDSTVFGTTGGTKLALLVSRPNGGITSFVEEESELTLFADDQGNSILGEGSFHNGFGSFPSLEDDGARLLVELTASGTPAPGSRTLKAKGKLVVAVSEMTETYRSPRIDIQEGAEVKAGSIPFRITAVGPPEWGDDAQAITLVADQNIDEVKSIRILGGNGDPIEFSRGSSGSMTVMGSVTVSRQFTFPEEQTAIVVEIEYWGGLRRIEVPFDLEVGIGL